MSNRHPEFRATITREDGLWIAVVDGDLPPGAVAATDVEHFADIKPAVRDLIAGLLEVNVDAGEFVVQWSFVQNGVDYSMVIEGLQEWEQAVAERDAYRAAAIVGMRRAGLSLRDIGDAVQLSHQRVHQLLAANDQPGDAPPQAITA